MGRRKRRGRRGAGEAVKEGKYGVLVSMSQKK